MMYKPIATKEDQMSLLREAHTVASVNVASDWGCLVRDNERLSARIAELEHIIESCSECKLTNKLLNSFGPNAEWIS